MPKPIGKSIQLRAGRTPGMAAVSLYEAGRPGQCSVITAVVGKRGLCPNPSPISESKVKQTFADALPGKESPDSSYKEQYQSIRVVPELNIAALANHKDKELLFWYLLRAINVTGCGHVLQSDAEKAFTEVFGYSRRTFYRHLSLGTGKLWVLYNNKGTTIQIYGIKTVCQWYSTYNLSRWVSVSVQDLLKYPRRSLLWNTGAYRPFGTGRVNHPISRQSLEDVTTIPERRQQRYDSKAETNRLKTQVKERDPLTYKTHSQLMPVSLKGECKTVLVKRSIGNIYYSHASQPRRGMLRKASKVAKEVRGSFLSAEAPNKALIPPQRFFNTFRDCVRATTKGLVSLADTYYPLKTNDTVYIQCTAI